MAESLSSAGHCGRSGRSLPRIAHRPNLIRIKSLYHVHRSGSQTATMRLTVLLNIAIYSRQADNGACFHGQKINILLSVAQGCERNIFAIR